MTVDAPPRTHEPEAGKRLPIRFLIAAGLIVIIGAVVGVVIGLTSGGSQRPPIPASFGSTSFSRVIPESVATIPLLDEQGRATNLAAFRGKTVVLADFLTSCQDECPISTGAFLDTERAIRADGLGQRVVIVDVSVDPGRDNPGRLRAYANYVGAHYTLLTGTSTNLAKLWKYFGVTYSKVPEDDDDDGPASLNWETGKPYTYDVDHSNSVFIIDKSGTERLLTEGLPNLHGQLSPNLHKLLSPLGIHHFEHPGFGAWTSQDLLQAIGWVLGRSVQTP